MSLPEGWERAGPAALPTRFGDFRVHAYTTEAGAQHAVIAKGDLADTPEPLLVRVHSSCVTGDIFGSLKCDCGTQLHSALNLISLEGRGAIVYLDQEGRGIGLTNKIRAYELQDNGRDTVEANEELGFAADERSYDDAAHILRDLGIGAIRLLTNNPKKVAGLTELGVVIDERVPLAVEPNQHNNNYLNVKALKLGHHLPAHTS